MNKKDLLYLVEKKLSFQNLMVATNYHKSKLIIDLLSLFDNELINRDIKEFLYQLINNNMYYQDYNHSSSFIIISDLHFGHKDEKPHLVEKVYNFAVINKIRDIYIAGDLIDGQFFSCNKNCENYQKQYNHFISTYPYDSTVRNYALLGNHDYLLERLGGIEMNKSLENDREDFTLMGYKRAYIKIFGDIIAFKHPIDIYKEYAPSHYPAVQFKGHSHKYQYKPKTEKNPPCFKLPHIFKPTDEYGTAAVMPGFLKVNFYTSYSHNYIIVELFNFQNNNIKYTSEKRLILEKIRR